MSREDDHIVDDDLVLEDEALEISDIEKFDADLASDIREIEDSDTRQELIRDVEKHISKDKAWRDRLDHGEISLDTYVASRQCTMLPKLRKLRTRCGLESVGMTYDDLGDLAEDNEFIVSGGDRMIDLKERIKTNIETIGTEAAQEHADRLLDEEELSKDAHDRISRQVRLSKRRRG